MSEVSNHIEELYNQLADGESMPISEEAVNKAIRLIDNFKLEDSASLFFFVSALNLLNAAIKKENLKSALYYGYIKSNVNKAAEFYLSNQDKFDGCFVYYDQNCKCFYFDILGVVFSFHQVKETKLITTVAANNNPIEWPGIRLQRIAQPVFEYGMQLAKTEIEDEVNNNNLISTETMHSSLVPCPDCGKMISKSASFCPNCGLNFYKEEEIAQDLSLGDSVQIIYKGNELSGIISRLGKTFLEITKQEGNLLRIKYSFIESLEKKRNSESFTSQIQAADSFIQQIENNIKKILRIEGYKGKDLISTNSKITQGGTGPFEVIMDDGRSVKCTKQGCVALGNKKIFLAPNIIGKRVFCANLSPDGICRCSMVEMSYDNLLRVVEKGMTKKGSKARTILFAVITYLNRFITKPEAYLELKEFEKSAEFFFGKFDVIIDSPEDDETDNYSDEGNPIAVSSSEEQRELYKTETEKSLLTQGIPQIKVVGKIDLDTLSGRNTSKKDIATDFNYPNISKPSILSSEKTLAFLNKNLVELTESRCKVLEKELDKLIREGQKEECLKRSYKIITESRPTPKYLRSYLDRIVNTEIALDHTEEALQSLAYLIAFSERQGECNANTLGHWYITMSRLLVKMNDKDEAYKAILYADQLKPNNSMVNKLMAAIRSTKPNIESGEDNKTDIDNGSEDIAINTISDMLLQDVEQEAHRQELLSNNEIVPAEQLLREAQNQRENQQKTNEEKATLYLEAAAAYYNSDQTETNIFKASIAYYALFKGHGMFARFSNLIRTNTGAISDIQAYRDSASSYYIEALVIFNVLGEKKYLQELFLKYLQMAIVVSNIEGGKTPADDWESWTLKQLQLDCLKADSIEEKNVLFNACIAIGTAAEGAWNTLYSDEDGLNPFISRFWNQSFKDESYRLLNELAGASVSSDFQPGAFMHKIFEYRQENIDELKSYLEDCLKWNFSPFDISTFEAKWNKVVEYKQLMTTTDRKVMNSIKEVIDVLRPYASRIKENERTRFLVRSQQILLGAQKTVTETATFYGRTFFSHLITPWLSKIAQLLEERYVNTYPKLEITPDPCYIKTNETGEGVIDFIVTNIGDSTAQSFVVNATINEKTYTVEHSEELPAGDCCVERFVSVDFLNIESIDVSFALTVRYEGKDLPPTTSEATYEVESGEVLTDEIQIPWKISDTPKENIFKGREEKLSTLINHYLSKDRTQTYILYGLTRTGKSSILDYLCERIEGQPLHEDPNKRITTFKWDFSKISFKNASVVDLWMNLLEINIYNKLSEDILDVVDGFFPDSKLPETLCQSDLGIMVDALNSCGLIPLITIDEFSIIKSMLKVGLVDATFISELRDLALKGKACFVYAGTYDIKELPKEKEFGIEGQMTNTRSMPINEIEQIYADELIDACESIIFVEKAKTYIRSLSGCVPYWIQWICLDCGKYAVAHKKRHLGYRDVDHVVKVLTGEEQPSKMDTWEAMDETNFQNNQFSPQNIAEQQLISCIAFLVRESTQIERGVSMDELTRLWDKYNVPSDKRLNMTRALKNLEEKKVIRQFTDETREVYRLNVDLFRRWWYVHHRDLTLEFSL